MLMSSGAMALNHPVLAIREPNEGEVGPFEYAPKILEVIDSTSDEVIYSAKTNHDFDWPYIIGSNEALAFVHWDFFDRVGRDYYGFHFSDNSLSHFAKTRGTFPNCVVKYQDHLFVVMDELWNEVAGKSASAVLVYQTNSDSAVLEETVHFSTNEVLRTWDNDKVWFNPTNGKLYLGLGPMLFPDFTRIGVFDCKTCQVEQVKDISGHVVSVSALCASDDKLYVASIRKRPRTMSRDDNNFDDEVSVFSLPDITFLGKIKIGSIIRSMTYSKDDGKIYLQYDNWGKKRKFPLTACSEIKVLNAKTDQLIKTIILPQGSIGQMSYVGNHKLYFIVKYSDKKTLNHGIYVIDTKTDTITTRLTGSYRAISKDFGACFGLQQNN